MAADATFRIFVVDDDLFVAHRVTLALRHVGFEVSVFTDTLSAAQQARLSAPDLVITDHAMPHIDGLVLTAWLQENCPDCKVVVMIRPSALLPLEETLGLRFTLLEKPVDTRMLIDAVRDIAFAHRKS